MCGFVQLNVSLRRDVVAMLAILGSNVNFDLPTCFSSIAAVAYIVPFGIFPNARITEPHLKGVILDELIINLLAISSFKSHCLYAIKSLGSISTITLPTRRGTARNFQTGRF